MKQFVSEHKLDFEVAPWHFSDDFQRFRVGTCTGLWACDEKSYMILAVDNSDQHNGHFNDVLQWFEQSCRRDKKTLKVLKLFNDRLKNHLIEKRGFKYIGNDNVEKHFPPLPEPGSFEDFWNDNERIVENTDGEEKTFGQQYHERMMEEFGHESKEFEL